MVNSSIKAVVFDLDGVYFEHGTERFMDALKKRYGLPEEKIREVYFRSPQMSDYKQGKITDSEFWGYAISEWGIPATQEELTNLLLEGYEENPDVLQFIDQLRRQHVKTAACTNNFPARLEGLDQRFGLSERFDVIVASYKEGVLKPDERIFYILADRLGCQPQEIVMSDDREANVQSLQRLGFQAFLYEGLDAFRRRIGE